MFSQSSTQPKYKTFKNCVPVSLFKNVAKSVSAPTVKTKKSKITKVKKHSKRLSSKIVETKNTIYILGNNKAVKNKFLKNIGSLTFISTDQSEETDADVDIEGIADTDSVETIAQERADPNDLIKIELDTDDHDLTEACAQPSGNTILIQQCRLPEVQLIHIPENAQSDICIQELHDKPVLDQQTQDFESISKEFRHFSSVEITIIFQEHAIVTALNADDISQSMLILDEEPKPYFGVTESNTSVERVFSCYGCKRVLIALLLPENRAAPCNCQECGWMMFDHSRHTYKEHLQCKICAEAEKVMRKHKRLNGHQRRLGTTPCVSFQTKYGMTAENLRKLITNCTTHDNKTPDRYSITTEHVKKSAAVSAKGCGIDFVDVVFSCHSCSLVIILYQHFGAPKISPTCPRCHTVLFAHTGHNFMEFEHCVPCGVAERVLALKPMQALQNRAKYPVIFAEVKHDHNLEVNNKNDMQSNKNQGLYVKSDAKDNSCLETDYKGNNFVFHCSYCNSVLVPFRCAESSHIDTSLCYVCLLQAQPHNVTLCTDSSTCGICSRIGRLEERKHYIEANKLSQPGSLTDNQITLPQSHSTTSTHPYVCTPITQSPSSATVSSDKQTVQPSASKTTKFISLDLSGFFPNINKQATNAHTTRSGRKYTKPWEVIRRGHNSGTADKAETEARMRKIVDSALRCQVVLPRVDSSLFGDTDCSVCATQFGSLVGVWLPCEVPATWNIDSAYCVPSTSV